MFTVVAGKYEAGGERNYKYIESFDTRQEAEEAMERVAGYPFSEMEVAPQALLQESMDRATGLVNRLNQRIDWHRGRKDPVALGDLLDGLSQLLESQEIGF